MSILRSLTSGVGSLFRKERAGQELDEELNGFIEMAAEEKMKEGASRKDALREVRLERGSLEVTKEEVRTAGWESRVVALWQDLRLFHAATSREPAVHGSGASFPGVGHRRKYGGLSIDRCGAAADAARRKSAGNRQGGHRSSQRSKGNFCLALPRSDVRDVGVDSQPAAGFLQSLWVGTNRFQFGGSAGESAPRPPCFAE